MPKSYSDRERGYIRKRLKEEAAACMGLCQIFQVFQQRQFQSTLPVWGATSRFSAPAHIPPDFNPRSPCGERLRQGRSQIPHQGFQSTLPVWGATSHLFLLASLLRIFQSTLPVWGAPSHLFLLASLLRIFQSTLPVWGATSGSSKMAKFEEYFNPRSPCGERPEDCCKCGESFTISIHAPRVGSDPLYARPG